MAMPSIKEELHSFTEFARQRVDMADATLDELFDLWRAENPSDELRAENVAAVRVAIQEFRNGDRGRPAGELSRELRQRHGLSTE